MTTSDPKDHDKNGVHRGGKPFGDDDDHFNLAGEGFDPGRHGFGHTPSPAFIRLVDALIAHPRHDATAGENAATSAQSSLFWAYDSHAGLMVEAAPGFLTTQTGNGGFNLFVGTNGEWALKFDGSNTVISSHDNKPLAPPPAGNTVVNVPGTGASPGINASAGDITVNGGAGWDTIQGGVGDYLIGGSGSLGGGLAGQGNCALYSASPGSVLVDMTNGHGYGGNADGSTYVNINQVRGSMFSNVLIGAATGTDLKSGGDNSLLISTGGSGYEMRTDGNNNVMVSTVGADRIVFDSSHGWLLGDTGNVVLGFNPGHGDSLDLKLLLGGNVIKETGGATAVSDFFSTSAVGYDPSTGTGDINAYVKIVDQSDGSHVMFDATGNVATAGVELVDLKLVHGLSAAPLLQSHAILT